MAVLKRNTGSKPATKSEPAKSTGDRFGQAYKKAEAAENKGLPIGVYEAFVTDAGIYRDEDSEKMAVWFEFTVVDNDKLEGRKGRIFYNLLDAEGEDMPGGGYLKRDIERLGFGDEEPASESDFEDLLERIKAEEIWCIIESKVNKGYTNLYLQDVPDQKDKPEAPESE